MILLEANEGPFWSSIQGGGVGFLEAQGCGRCLDKNLNIVKGKKDAWVGSNAHIQ